MAPAATAEPANTRPATAERSFTDQLTELAAAWSQSQHRIVMLAVALADSAEWILAGSRTPAHHIAAIADVEPCTAREWLRVGKRVRGLPTTATAFANGTLSYAKVRALIVVATPDNEEELAALAIDTPAGALREVLAHWMGRNLEPDDLTDHQNRQRSVKWRTEPDGMTTFTLRLPPYMAAILISRLTRLVMTSRPKPASDGSWPNLAQQHADALHNALTTGTGGITTEIVLHVRGDGNTTDNGTPITDTVITDIAPQSYIRALIHDAQGRPINASAKQRHPSTRQRRVVKERDRTCIDCGRTELLEYDHNPNYKDTRHTIIEELELRCAPCHHRRHQQDSA